MAVAVGSLALAGCRDAAPPASGDQTDIKIDNTTSGLDSGATPAPTPTPSQSAVMAPRPIYGPPAGFPGDRIPGLKGAVAIAALNASVPVPNADKQLTIAQPALRTCYQSGLRVDPLMSGTLNVVINVGADGKVTSATVDGPASDTVRACMKDRLQHIKFDAPSAASTITTTFTLTSTHD